MGVSCRDHHRSIRRGLSDGSNCTTTHTTLPSLSSMIMTHCLLMCSFGVPYRATGRTWRESALIARFTAYSTYGIFDDGPGTNDGAMQDESDMRDHVASDTGRNSMNSSSLWARQLTGRH